MKLENEISILPANSEHHSMKITELSQLKSELQSLRERQSHRRSNKTLSTYQETKQSPTKLTRNSTKKSTKGPDILVINDSVSSTKRQSPHRPKIHPFNKTKKTNQFINTSHPRSNSAPWTGSREVSAESSNQTTSRDLSSKRVISLKRKPKTETPKFEQGTKSQSRSNLAKIVSQQRLDRRPSQSVYASPQKNNSFTGILKEDSKFSYNYDRLNMSHSPQITGDRTYETNASPLRKPQFMTLSKSKSDLIATEFPERQSIRLKSKERVNAGKIVEILEKNQELKSLKDKNFDFADEEEEYFVKKKLNDCTREKMINKYKTLFYKSREIKELLNDMTDNSYLMSKATEMLKDERDLLNNENNQLKKQLETTLKEISEQQRDNESVIREYEERVLNAVNEKNYLSQKLNETAMQYELATMNMKNDSKSINQSAFISNREQYQSQRSLATNGNIALEARIQVTKISINTWIICVFFFFLCNFHHF